MNYPIFMLSRFETIGCIFLGRSITRLFNNLQHHNAVDASSQRNHILATEHLNFYIQLTAAQPIVKRSYFGSHENTEKLILFSSIRFFQISSRTNFTSSIIFYTYFLRKKIFSKNLV